MSGRAASQGRAAARRRAGGAARVGRCSLRHALGTAGPSPATRLWSAAVQNGPVPVWRNAAMSTFAALLAHNVLAVLMRPAWWWKAKSVWDRHVRGLMAKGRRSLQDRIRERQQSGFVGRQGQVIQYQENLGFPVDDERRRFLFNIHGDAGVGKTYLTRQLRQIATGSGALTAYIDETVDDVTSAMTAIAAAVQPRWRQARRVREAGCRVPAASPRAGIRSARSRWRRRVPHQDRGHDRPCRSP